MELRFNGGSPSFYKRGKLFLSVTNFTIFLFLCPLLAAQSEEPREKVINENTSASLEMITERMKALSGSLAAIPDPPRLNQVIQIPDGFGPAENSEESHQVQGQVPKIESDLPLTSNQKEIQK